MRKPLWTRAVRPLALLAVLWGLAYMLYPFVVNTAEVPDSIGFWAWRQDNDRLMTHHPDPRARLLFLGDSITAFWSTTGRDVFNDHFGRYGAENYGVSADRTDGLLWRMQQGELNGLHPRVIVLMIGTNNVTRFIGDVLHYRRPNSPSQVAAATAIVLATLQRKFPGVKIVVLSILPRRLISDRPGDNDDLRAINARNRATCHGASDLFYLDVSRPFTAPDGKANDALFRDGIHPNHRGYALLAAQLDQPLHRLMATSGTPSAAAPERP